MCPIAQTMDKHFSIEYDAGQANKYQKLRTLDAPHSNSDY